MNKEQKREPVVVIVVVCSLSILLVAFAAFGYAMEASLKHGFWFGVAWFAPTIVTIALAILGFAAVIEKLQEKEPEAQDNQEQPPNPE